jgi:hypothetical protein
MPGRRIGPILPGHRHLVVSVEGRKAFDGMEPGRRASPSRSALLVTRLTGETLAGQDAALTGGARLTMHRPRSGCRVLHRGPWRRTVPDTLAGPARSGEARAT